MIKCDLNLSLIVAFIIMIFVILIIIYLNSHLFTLFTVIVSILKVKTNFSSLFELYKFIENLNRLKINIDNETSIESIIYDF